MAQTNRKRRERQQRKPTRPSLRLVVNHERMALTPGALRHRAELLAEAIALYPDDVARGLAARDEANWCFGRLYLIGAIDMPQYNEAKRFSAIHQRWKRMLHRYGLLDAQNLDGLANLAAGHEDLSDGALKAAHRLQSDYNELRGRLTSAGIDAREAILHGLEKDKITDLRLIRRALDALSKAT